MQSDEKGRSYHGAETISEQGEIIRPAEAAVLADDEERITRSLRPAKPGREHNSKTTSPGPTHQLTVSSKARVEVSNDTALTESSYDSNKYFKVPQCAERFLVFFLGKKKREYLIGDLQEEYVDIRSRHGAKFANAWYWKQVLASIFSMKLGSVLRRSAVVLFGEWIRRKIF